MFRQPLVIIIPIECNLWGQHNDAGWNIWFSVDALTNHNCTLHQTTPLKSYRNNSRFEWKFIKFDLRALRKFVVLCWKKIVVTHGFRLIYWLLMAISLIINFMVLNLCINYKGLWFVKIESNCGLVLAFIGVFLSSGSAATLPGYFFFIRRLLYLLLCSDRQFSCFF